MLTLLWLGSVGANLISNDYDPCPSSNFDGAASCLNVEGTAQTIQWVSNWSYLLVDSANISILSRRCDFIRGYGFWQCEWQSWYSYAGSFGQHRSFNVRFRHVKEYCG